MTSLIAFPPPPALERVPDTSLLDRPGPTHAKVGHSLARGLRRTAVAVVTGPRFWLLVILICQGALAYSTAGVSTAFEDEGLYIFEGHRMIAHLLHGLFLQEYPGSFFSGAPGIYPIIAAMVDDVGGLPAVRALSLVFALISTVGVYGISRQLMGRLAGLLGAASFAVCASVLYQSQWATYDSMAMALMALGAWLAIYSGRKDGLMWAPVVAILLTLAVLTKYAVAVYVPAIAVVVIADQFSVRGWRIVRRSTFMLASWGIAMYFILMLWGRSLLHGISQTTTSRQIIQPTPRLDLVRDVIQWAGPWLLIALLGGIVLVFRDRSRAPLVVVLLGTSVVGALQQIHIGELTSLAKHLAFGMVFAAPLIGYMLARLLRVRWRLGVLPVAIVIFSLGAYGVDLASYFRTGYPSDVALQPILRQALADNPGGHILGEQSSPQRFELSDITAAKQWSDTYTFGFGGKSGPAAYREAIKDHYFAVIFLSFSTANATPILQSLGSAQGPDHYYNLVAKVPRMVRGKRNGDWLVWAPKSSHMTPIS